jgi:hypothetical protein
MNRIRIIIVAVAIICIYGCKKDNSKAESINLIEDLDVTKDAVFDTVEVPQHIRKIVKDISGINVYETSVLAKGATVSENFENFKKLKEIASDDELISLLNNKNKVVAVYAAIGLWEKMPERTDQIFQQFLQIKTQIHTRNGCIVGDENPAEPLYSQYINSLNGKDIIHDTRLKKLDSLVIFSPNPSEILLTEVFRYKLYPKQYNKQIEMLAFTNHKIPAINYLNHWYKGDYSNLLQKEFGSIISNDTLIDINKQKALSDLLSFRNPANKKVILDYIKKDTLSIKEHEISIELENNGIFPGKDYE